MEKAARTRSLGHRGLALGLLLLSAGAGCTFGANTEVRGPAPERGADRFVDARGYRLHFLELGAGAPVVLIPGAYSTCRTWNRMLPLLGKRCRALAWDYLGTGNSPQPEELSPYDPGEQAELLAEAIRSLGLGKVRAVGVSYGSLIALNLAARHPELTEAVTCVETGAVSRPAVLFPGESRLFARYPIVADLFFALVKTGALNRALARSVMGEAWEVLKPSERDEIEGIVAHSVATASRASWRNIYLTIHTDWDYTQLASTLRVPVLYLYGSKSKYREMAEINASIFRESVSGARVVRVEGGIHDLELQLPTEMTELLAAFWRGDGETNSAPRALAAPR